jgi:tetratricopeptide (TPR) repeat protein
VPPALNALIMRCLEKKPADRPQRADELRAQLDALATPTGGMTPTESAPISTGTLAAYRRAHPIRVAALFAGAALAVLGVVWLLMRQVGLPAWVLPAALGLLAVGLPIVLVTGRFERRRALARTTGTTIPTTGVHGLFTWRRAMTGGGIAFAGLGLVTAGYMGMRALGIGPVGTLVASGALKQEARVLLAEFVNNTADAALGHTLTDAFRVDFAQSRVVRVADAAAVGDALARMGRPATDLLTPDVARELAQREGIPAVIVGQVDPVGSAYVLSASVVAAADGRTLTAVRANAGNDAELIAALDQLSKDLRERIGESFRSLNRARPLDRVTTASLEALRKFTRAQDLADASDYEGAAALLREAVSLDTGFAMAYRKLAVVLGNSGASWVEVAHAARRAYLGRDRLPELERHLATAYYHYTQDWDVDRIIAAYRGALEVDPENDAALNNLANALMRERQWASAESLYLRGLDLGHGGVYWGNTIAALMVQGKLDQAEGVLDRYAKAAPGNPDVLESRLELASARGDYAAVERHARELLLAHRAIPRWRQVAAAHLARAEGALGKLAEARRYGREAMDAAAQRALPAAYLSGATQLARFDLVYRGSAAAALDTVTAALRRFPLESIPAIDRPYPALIQLYADAGDATRAKRLMSEYERVVPEGIRRADWFRHMAAGALAEAEGRSADAIASYRAAREENGYCEFCGYFQIARVHAQAGDTDSARAYYERAVNTSSPYRYFADGFETASAYQRLGELYEATGDRAQALEYYGRLIEMWQNADSQLQPIVRDVRARVARLSAER